MDLAKGGLVGMAFERTKVGRDRQEQGLLRQLDLRQRGRRCVTVVAQERCASPPCRAHRSATPWRT